MAFLASAILLSLGRRSGGQEYTVNIYLHCGNRPHFLKGKILTIALNVLFRVYDCYLVIFVALGISTVDIISIVVVYTVLY